MILHMRLLLGLTGGEIFILWREQVVELVVTRLLSSRCCEWESCCRGLFEGIRPSFAWRCKGKTIKIMSQDIQQPSLHSNPTPPSGAGALSSRRPTLCSARHTRGERDLAF
jgi:hypothetical protein